MLEPGDWAAHYGDPGYTFSAQHNGDPDGDIVSQYYFEFTSAGGTITSGWISSSSWTPPTLAPNGYEWRVKVRDNLGAESSWSEIRHLTIYDPHIDIIQLEFVPLDAAGEIVRILACADAPSTLRVDVNSANDGSGSGEWQILKELGVPCFNDIDAPTWNTLEYTPGPHLVRVLARGDGGWENAAIRTDTYTVPVVHRPNQPYGLLPKNGSYINGKTVTFDWIETLRTTSHRLQAAADADFNTLLLDKAFTPGTTAYTHTFASDYATVYWRVIATGPYGTNESTQSFHIDITAPTSSITSLPSVTTDTQFSLNWAGSDARAGVRWYHVQVRDGDRIESQWTDWLVNTTKTAEIYQGQTGHKYYFRVRAMDEIGNWEEWPENGNGDTYTIIDPSSAPQTPWWNTEYAQKRNLIILNNDSDAIPTHFPMHIHFDSSTTPTAAEIYNASLSTVKGNDVRIVYDNQLELDRFVQRFTTSQIDIWFPMHVALGGGQSDSSSYQIYYGYVGSSNPPASVNNVFLPQTDANTIGLWHFQDGSGTTVNDSSGRNHHGTFSDGSWGDGYSGWTGIFNGVNTSVNAGNSTDFNLNSFTVEAWVYFNDVFTGDMPLIISKKHEGGDGGFELRLTGERKLFFFLSGDYMVSNTALEPNHWYHVAASLNNSNLGSIYINGASSGSKVFTPTTFNNDPLLIGYGTYTQNPVSFPVRFNTLRYLMLPLPASLTHMLI